MKGNYCVRGQTYSLGQIGLICNTLELKLIQSEIVHIGKPIGNQPAMMNAKKRFIWLMN